jgi:hypothetical protein
MESSRIYLGGVWFRAAHVDIVGVHEGFPSAFTSANTDNVLNRVIDSQWLVLETLQIACHISPAAGHRPFSVMGISIC